MSLFKMDFSIQQCSATLNGDAVLTEMAFAVEAAVSHFLGRKVHRFECRRSRLNNGDCHLEFNALKQSGPMVVSKVMDVYTAIAEGVIPRQISEPDSFLTESGFMPKAEDGQHRHKGYSSKRESGLTTTVVESDGFSSNSTLSLISYGLGDMFTGLFALNVSHIKWQGSARKTQLFFKHNLSDKQVADYLRSRQDYDINRKIKSLA